MNTTVWVQKSWMPGSPSRISFVGWPLISVGPDHETCFTSRFCCHNFEVTPIFLEKNCADSNRVTTHGLNFRTPTHTCGKRKAPTNLNAEVSWKTVTWKKGLNFGDGRELKLLTLTYWRITKRDLYVAVWKLRFLKTQISPIQHTKKIISNELFIV